MTTATSSPGTPSTASWGDLFSGRNGLLAVALTGSVALHAINVHIVTTVLPSVVREIGGLDWYAWNTTLFVVASIIGAALSVRVLAGSGPRGACLAALALFSLGTLGCATALSMPWMLAARAVQGLGGGLLAALSYALIRVVFEPPLWPRAVALVSGMWGVATLCGPAVGGLFAEAGHWRWAFWSLLPVAAAQALLVTLQLGPRERGTGAPPRVPVLQIVLLAASVLAVATASRAGHLAWQGAGVVLGLALGALALRVDRQARVRLLPSGSSSLGAPLGAAYACVALLLVGTTTEIFVPYFLQVLHGQTPLLAGYLTAAMAAGWSIGSLTLLAASALAAVGAGVGLGWPHLLTRVMALAPKGEEDAASTAITTVQLYGMAIGAAVAGLVANAAGLIEPGGEAGARSAAIWLFSGFILAPALAAWLVRRVAER